MATKKNGAGSGASDGRSDGRSDGASDGQSDGAMDFDAFLVWLPEQRGKILDVLGIANSGGGGFRVGDVAYEPVDTLEERVRTKYPGTHDFLLRAKDKRGRIAGTGRLRYETSPSSSTATNAAPVGVDATLAPLITQLVDRALKQSAQQATAPAPLGEQVGALGQLTSTLTSLASIVGGGASKAADVASSALDKDSVMQFIELGKQLQRGTSGESPSFWLQALDLVKGDVKEMLSTIVVAARMQADAAEAKQAAALAERKAAEARAKAAESQQ